MVALDGEESSSRDSESGNTSCESDCETSIHSTIENILLALQLTSLSEGNNNNEPHMTIRKSKPERRRDRDRDGNHHVHRQRSGHPYRDPVNYWRSNEYRGFNHRGSSRHMGSTSAGSSGACLSGNTIHQDTYGYNDNYGWSLTGSDEVDSAKKKTPERKAWKESSEDDVTSDHNNSDDEYKILDSFSREEDIEFARRLREAKGFEIKIMAEDGACLFRAVAHQVFGDSAMHEEVRRLCIDYIALNRDHFSQFITEDFDRYVERKRKADCHGNHVELQAISEMYNRPLEIYRYSTEPQLLAPQKDPGTRLSPIRLSYHQEGHYNAVVDPYEPNIGVGLGIPNYQPGLSDRLQLDIATKESELFELEECMLKDKMKETNIEAVQEQIEKQVAAESFLEWINKKGGSNDSDPNEPPSGPSRPLPPNKSRCKVKGATASSSAASCGGVRSPNNFTSHASPHSPHATHVLPTPKSPMALHACGSGTSAANTKRRSHSSRSSSSSGSGSPQAYGATAAPIKVAQSVASPIPTTSNPPPATTVSAPVWNGVQFNETASLMNGAIPSELQEWDDFIVQQVLMESEREYWLKLTRSREKLFYGGEHDGGEGSDEAGCSKD